MKARIPGQNGQSQAAMMKQVQKMQADMTNLQAELEEREFTAQAGGGMVEKSLRAKATTSYVLNGREMNTETNKLSMKELQWSVNAAAGIQLNITKEVGIYAEPGVGYYFDNGSDVKTAYSDNPFNFNMKLGLRYSIK